MTCRLQIFRSIHHKLHHPDTSSTTHYSPRKTTTMCRVASIDHKCGHRYDRIQQCHPGNCIIDPSAGRDIYKRPDIICPNCLADRQRMSNGTFNGTFTRDIKKEVDELREQLNMQLTYQNGGRDVKDMLLRRFDRVVGALMKG